MTDYPMLAMGPEPFRFLPSGDPLQGTAFSWPFKLLAAIIVLGGALWLADLWLAGKLGASSRQGGGACSCTRLKQPTPTFQRMHACMHIPMSEPARGHVAPWGLPFSCGGLHALPL